MKVIHTITSMDKNSGGTSTYLQLLSGEVTKKINLKIVTFESPNPLPMSDRVEVLKVKKSFLNVNGYSGALYRDLIRAEVDIYHGNGLWQFPVSLMARAAKKRKLPFIISPHGMLEPWAMDYNKWKKKAPWFFFQRQDLIDAACIHATAVSEAINIRKLGFENPIAVIPNGVEISTFLFSSEKLPKQRKTLLFLSRIHPKKGIELLLEAWQQLDPIIRHNWQIEIAGNGEESYIASLQKKIAAAGIGGEVKIKGPQFEEAKINSFRRADLFVLPTYSENFGIVVAEALASGVPVITTKGAPWEQLIKTNSGWWIDIGVEPLVQTLEKALQMPDDVLKKMGQNGRKLVEEKYCIEVVAKQMLELYKWILDEGEKPKFVELL